MHCGLAEAGKAGVSRKRREYKKKARQDDEPWLASQYSCLAAC